MISKKEAQEHLDTIKELELCDHYGSPISGYYDKTSVEDLYPNEIAFFQQLINQMPDDEVKLSEMIGTLRKEIQFAPLVIEDLSIGYYEHTEYDGSYWIPIVALSKDMTIKEIDCELGLPMNIRAYLFDLFRHKTKIIDDLEVK